MARQNKRLTEDEFQATINGLDVGEQTKKIAYGVLVKGESQAEHVKSTGLTRGGVSQAVTRVWEAYINRPDTGYERVNVVLPAHRAFIVKKWAKEVKEK